MTKMLSGADWKISILLLFAFYYSMKVNHKMKEISFEECDELFKNFGKVKQKINIDPNKGKNIQDRWDLYKELLERDR